MTRLNKIKTLTFLVVAISWISVNSQDIHDLEHSKQFAEYLLKTNQFNQAAEEFERILFMDPLNDDVKLYLIKSYRLASESSKALQKINTLYPIPETDFTEDLAKEYVRNVFQENKLSDVEDFISKDVNLTPGFKNETEVVLFLLKKDWDSANLFAANHSNLNKTLRSYVDQASNINYKSPALAASMSAIVPGSGKVYAGQWKDGIIGFLFIASSAWQSYRGFQKNGVESAYGWIFGGISFGFYTGNIFGSYKAVRQYNQQKDNSIVSKTRSYIKHNF